MGPCKDCGNWGWRCICVASFLDDLADLDEHRKETMLQHRTLKAKCDPAFQTFMGKVING